MQGELSSFLAVVLHEIRYITVTMAERVELVQT